MKMLADLSDVAARLGEEVPENKVHVAEGLLEEASALVEGYLGRTFDEVPRPVSVEIGRAHV